jgi:hypothetical protein
MLFFDHEVQRRGDGETAFLGPGEGSLRDHEK